MTHVVCYLLIAGETKSCTLHTDEVNTGKKLAMLFFAYG